MTCYNCKNENKLSLWLITTKTCVADSCSENSARICPSCEETVGHTWLDTQTEWKNSAFYKK